MVLTLDNMCENWLRLEASSTSIQRLEVPGSGGVIVTEEPLARTVTEPLDGGCHLWRRW